MSCLHRIEVFPRPVAHARAVFDVPGWEQCAGPIRNETTVRVRTRNAPGTVDEETDDEDAGERAADWKMYTGEPVEEDGKAERPQQMNVGRNNMEGIVATNVKILRPAAPINPADRRTVAFTNDSIRRRTISDQRLVIEGHIQPVDRAHTSLAGSASSS